MGEGLQRALSDVWLHLVVSSAMVRLAAVEFRKQIDTNGQQETLALW